MINHLAGLRVLNTRPDAAGKQLSLAIEAAHGVAIACPAIEIEAITTDWLSLCPPFESLQKAIFISANAVNFFFTRLQQQGIHWPDSIEQFAVGQATANALRAQQIRVDYVPDIADSEHLLALPALQSVAFQSILIIKGEEGRTLIQQTLLARQAKLFCLDVYRRNLPQANTSFLTSLWQNDAVDIILFTSQQAMHHIFTLFGDEARTWLCQKPCLVWSERLAHAALTMGMRTVYVCQPEFVIDALHQFTQGTLHARQQ